MRNRPAGRTRPSRAAWARFRAPPAPRGSRWPRRSPRSDRYGPPRARCADPSARSARPRPETDTGSPGSRTSGRRRPDRAPSPQLPHPQRDAGRAELDLRARREGVRGAGRAALDLVPRVEGLRAADPAPVKLDPVGGAEVIDDPRPARGPHLGVVAGDVGIVEHDVGVARAAEPRARGTEYDRAALRPQPRRPAPVIGLAQRLRDAVGHRVDHRVALIALARMLFFMRGRAHEPRLDAELAQPQALVGLERDLRLRHEVDPLAPRVLEQVSGQLARQLVLVALELRAILR